MMQTVDQEHPNMQPPPYASQPLHQQQPQPAAPAMPASATVGSAPVGSGQPQVIVLRQGGSGSPVKHDYAALTSRTLGVIQIIGGVLAIVFSAVLIGIGSITGVVGSGIWCGVFFIIAGSFGIAAGKHRTRCLIITYMVMAIIAAVICVGIFSSAAPGVASDKSEMKWRHDYDYGNYIDYEYQYDYRARYPSYWNSTSTIPPFRHTTRRSTPEPDNSEYYNYWYSSVAFNTLLMIVGLVELITLIWGSVLGCKVTCCGSQPQHMALPVQYADGRVYVMQGNQLIAVPTYPAQPQGAAYPPNPQGIQCVAPAPGPQYPPQQPMYAAEAPASQPEKAIPSSIQLV